MSDFLQRNTRGVFRDVDNIGAGSDFEFRIIQAVVSSRVVIAVIGPNWLTAIGENGNRRIDDPRDFVRMEISTALKGNVPTIPVLVGGATLPKAAELPDDLKPLSRRPAYELTDERWAYDCERILHALKPLIKSRRFPGRSIIAALTLLAAFAGTMAGYLLGFHRLDNAMPDKAAGDAFEKDFRANLATYDPQIFFGPQNYSVARLFPDRNTTDVDSGLESILAATKTSFDMAVIDGRHTLESHRQHIQNAIRRGVTFRIILFDSSMESNRIALAQATNQKPVTLKADFDAARDILNSIANWITSEGLPSNRLQVRFYPRILMYTTWIKDRDDKELPPVTRVKLHLFSDKSVWPAFHIARDGKELARNLSRDFEDIWSLSNWVPGGPAQRPRGCQDVNGRWNDVSNHQQRMTPMSIYQNDCFISADFRDPANKLYHLIGQFEGSTANVLILRKSPDCDKIFTLYGSLSLQDAALSLDIRGTDGNCNNSPAYTDHRPWERARPLVSYGPRTH